MSASKSGNAAFRVDASPLIGTGHIMRCLTLAGALKESGWRTRFVSRHMPETFRAMLQEGEHEFVALEKAESSGPVDELTHADSLGARQSSDARESIRALCDRRWDWLLVDHYALDARWEFALRPCTAKILVIDDLANRMHDCDVLLDQNLREDGGAAYDELLPSNCERLLGPRFALIDSSFAAARAGLRAQHREGVLVSFGGSDPQSMTVPVLRALLRTSSNKHHIYVAVGLMHGDVEAVRSLAAGNPNVHLHHATRDMAGIMARSRLYVGAGGSTSWERCCLALPGIVVSVTENQEALCLALHDAGSHIYLGRASEVSPDAVAEAAMAMLASPAWWSRLAERSSSIVDGSGASRVAARLRIGEVRLREASAQDEETVLAWRNDPAVRQYSGSGQEISRADHSRWFARVLADPNCHLLIGYDAHGESGVLRYDVVSHSAKVSIYVVPNRLGSGVGAPLLAAGERWLSARRPDVNAIRAGVHAGNRASVRLFASAGYRAQKHDYVKTLIERKSP